MVLWMTRLVRTAGGTVLKTLEAMSPGATNRKNTSETQKVKNVHVLVLVVGSLISFTGSSNLARSRIEEHSSNSSLRFERRR